MISVLPPRQKVHPWERSVKDVRTFLPDGPELQTKMAALKRLHELMGVDPRRPWGLKARCR